MSASGIVDRQHLPVSVIREILHDCGGHVEQDTHTAVAVVGEWNGRGS